MNGIPGNLPSTIYLAGPLFCASELDYNRKLRDYLNMNDFRVLLPQENDNGIDSEKMVSQEYAVAKSIEVYRRDLDMVDRCDALVINLDGRVPDEGACVELGYAGAKGIPCFGIKTDVRAAEYGTDNMMITGALGGRVARSPAELVGMLRAAGL